MPLEAIRRANRVLWKPGDRLLLGVSGGGDSMALLHALAELAPSHGIALRVAHVNHLLRGRAADADAQFVSDVAKGLGIPCTTIRVDVRARAKRSGRSLEMEARVARHAAFARLCRRHRMSAVVLAHTADDQAEGVLLRLVRGAGREALSGMSGDTRIGGLRIVRPLLAESHASCLAFLRERHAEWREDATNRNDAMLRNRVRHELLPLLEQRFNPAIRTILLRTAAILAEDESLLCDLADRAYARHVHRTGLSLRAARLPSAVRSRILMRWLREALHVPPERVDQRLLERVLDLLAARTTSVNLPGGLHLVRCGAVLQVARARPVRSLTRVALAMPGRTEVPALGVEVIVTRSKGWKPDPAKRVGELPSVGHLAGTVTHVSVRGRRAGDRIAPIGMTGSTSLQDLLVNAKVPEEERASIPVFVSGSAVVWLPGYRVARNAAVVRKTDASWRLAVRALPGGVVS